MNTAAKTFSLIINPRTLQLGGAGGWIDVSAPECELLQTFASADFQRLDIPKMLERVGKLNDASGKKALGVQIVRLRQKLEKAGAPTPTIKSIRGVGYQLCVPLHILSPVSPAGDGVLSATSSIAIGARQSSNL